MELEESIRCIVFRLSERVLAAVPPMTKEERRRAFAEAAAAADESRRREQHQHQHQHFRYWPGDGVGFAQMFPRGLLGAPPNLLLPVLPDEAPWQAPPPDFPQAPFFPPFAGPQALCVPQHK